MSPEETINFNVDELLCIFEYFYFVKHIFFFLIIRLTIQVYFQKHYNVFFLMFVQDLVSNKLDGLGPVHNGPSTD